MQENTNDLSEMSTAVRLRTIKSFAVRNRTLTGLKAKIYQDNYKKWGLSCSDNPDRIWDFQKIFKNQNPVILEIGFGNGETLLQDANSQKNVNYLGIEVYQKGILNILTALDLIDSIDLITGDNKDLENLGNLRVCQADVKLAFDCIPDHSLAGVQIFFPDPWPKPRHHKRRLIQTEFINILVTKIAKGGFIHLATDWADYARHMKIVMDLNADIRELTKQLSDQLSGQLSENKMRFMTKYERRGLKYGHKIVDLKYIVI